MNLNAMLGLSAGETLIPINETDEVFLGMGYDTLTDEFHDGIVAAGNSKPSEDKVISGQKVYSFIDVLETASEFLETLNISMSASAKGFGGKASASYSLYRSLTMNTKDVFALFYVNVIDKVNRIYDPELSERAKEEWRNQKTHNRKRMMVTTYGDSYVSRAVTGGQLLATIKIHASSRREREEITISAKASFASFRVEGNYKHIEDFFRQHSHTVMDIRRDGGAGKLPTMDLKALLEAALSFPEQVREHPVQIFAATKPISQLQDGNTNIDLHSDEAFNAVNQLGAFQAAVREKKAEADFILASPELFVSVDPAEISNVVVTLNDYALDASSIYNTVISDRFSFQLQKELPDARDLPSLPRVISGTAVPLVLHVNGKNPHGGAWDVEGTNDQWIGSDALFGLSINSSALSPSTNIEYSLRDNDGHTSVGKNGSTVTVGAKAQFATGMIITVKGEHASRYSVTYAIRTAAGNAVYYAQDGELLSVWRGAYGWRITAIKVGLILN